MKAKIKGKIEHGIFYPNSMRNYQNALLAMEGKEVEFTIGPITKTRTNPQNSYLWGVPYKIISEYTGDDTESIHNYLRNEFLSEPGNTVPKVKSTSKLSTTEFNQYVDNIIRWAAEFLGLYIPLPMEEEMWGDAKRRT